MTQLNASAVLSDVLSAEARLSNVVQGSEPATGNAAAEDVLSGKTFSNSAESGITGSMPNIGAQNITPSTAIQLIAKGYHNGSGAVAGDADLIPSNIKTGVSIFGVNGNVVPEDFSEVNEALDSLNQEIIGSDPLVKISFAEGWRDDIKDSIAAYGVTMTDVKPDDYDTKIALIGAAVTAPYKTALDAANEEASADLTAGIALVDANYGEISAAITAAGVSMTGVKPSKYDAKITEAVYNACFVTVLGNIKDYNVAVGGTTANIPASVGGMAITAIGYGVTGALAAKGLVALTIPSGVTYIGTNAFYDNNIQNAVTVPEGVTVIEPSAFRSNANLPGATLPNSLTDIKTYIFGDCDLISLTLGNAVTAIAADAFRGNALPEITLPSTLLTIGNYAFYDSPIVRIIIGADVSMPNTDPYPTMGIYGSGFLTLYNSNGKLAGTYEYSAGTWSKTA